MSIFIAWPTLIHVGKQSSWDVRNKWRTSTFEMTIHWTRRGCFELTGKGSELSDLRHSCQTWSISFPWEYQRFGVGERGENWLFWDMPVNYKNFTPGNTAPGTHDLYNVEARTTWTGRGHWQRSLSDPLHATLWAPKWSSHFCAIYRC